MRTCPSESPYRSCMLCPRGCAVDRESGIKGACGSDSTMRVARIGLHEWEEPPISGLAGSGTVFFTGCSLGCCYCQNSAISRKSCGREISVEDLASSCLELQQAGAMNVNFVTPTHFAPSIRRSVSVARSKGLFLPIVWNTSGYESAQEISRNDGYVDVYLTDFKYSSRRSSRLLSGVADYPDVATVAIAAMVEQVGPPEYDEYGGTERMSSGVVVRHLVLPGHVEESMAAIERIHREFGSDVRLSIMNQYTPILCTAAERGDARALDALERFPELASCVPYEDYECVLDFADSIGVDGYFWQEGMAAVESFIPDFDRG